MSTENSVKLSSFGSVKNETWEQGHKDKSGAAGDPSTGHAITEEEPAPDTRFEAGLVTEAGPIDGLVIIYWRQEDESSQDIKSEQFKMVTGNIAHQLRAPGWAEMRSWAIGSMEKALG